MAVKITWLGHASFKIEGEEGLTIYLDPWKIKAKDEADLIFISHSHYDHLSPDDVNRIQGKATTILVPTDGVGKLRGEVRAVKPGDSLSLKGINVRAVPAYNLNKPYHPKENGWVGYFFEVETISIYHAGDTDFVPEMNDLKPSVALLPIGGTYTMDVENALAAVEAIKPRMIIPMHFGDIVGTLNDAKRFAEKCPVEVRILGKGESIDIE